MHKMTLSMHHRGCPVVVARCAATNAWICANAAPRGQRQICLPRLCLLVSLAARCPTVFEFVSLVRFLDESLEEFLRGSPLRSNKYDGAAEGDMSTAAGLEGAWSTRVASRTRGPRGRPSPPRREPSDRERRPSLPRPSRPPCSRPCRPGARGSCRASPRTCTRSLRGTTSSRRPRHVEVGR